MNITAVPVIYYHSVKPERKKNWVHPHIIMELENFHKHLKFFNTLKIKTFFTDDLYFHIKGEKKLPFNSMVINFDDGYLDNFMFAFPLLKKYKLKATIWLNPDFVNKNDTEVRPTLEDYWNGKITLPELNNYDGFLNWEEMRLMEKSGLVEIQSHTLTHTKYPVSDKIIDFVSPNTKIDWLYWNLFPDDKINFLTNPRYKIPFGFPIYESEKGNIAFKYEEDGSLTEGLIEYVNKNVGRKFFEENNWKEKLFMFVNKFKNENNVTYKKESVEEFDNRIRFELTESKRMIEKNLDKKVNHVCWPFGGWNERTVKLADECGYLTNTACGQKNILNKNNYKRVDRIALDNPKYQNYLFELYALFKLFEYKL